MNIPTLFKQQIDQGATDRFSYGIEHYQDLSMEVKYHNGTLDTFPKGLEYVRTSFGIPFFKIEK